jgi:hypothetical protein
MPATKAILWDGGNNIQIYHACLGHAILNCQGDFSSYTAYPCGDRSYGHKRTDSIGLVPGEKHHGS